MSEEVTKVRGRRKQTFKKLVGWGRGWGERLSQEEGPASAQVLWHVEQGIGEPSEDQGAEWDGNRTRWETRQGQAARGFVSLGTCRGKLGRV